MSGHNKRLGVMVPSGGGDPIPLNKSEITIGRRPTCDVRLDFENVSGKHCQLRFVEGVWLVRDLGSTNGTTLNRQKLNHEHSVMPDDEVGIASHYFSIDYEPASLVQESNEVLEREMERAFATPAITGRKSLLEQAGLDEDADAKAHLARVAAKKAAAAAPVAPEVFGDPLPASVAHSSNGSAKPRQVTDDDFLRMIEDDIKG